MAESVETFLYWSDINDPNNSVTDSLSFVWYLPANYMYHDRPDTPFDDTVWYNLPSLRANISGQLNINGYIKSTIPSLDIGNNKPIELILNTPLEYSPFVKYRVEDYTSLVTWQHRKPKFLATVTSLVKPYVDIMNAAWKVESRGFNIDTANGTQLDILGEWVGLSRHVNLEIPDNFFGYGYTPDSDPRNWGSGIWAPYGRIPTTSYSLNDSIYRFFLKIKIVLNNWDGSVNGLYEAFNSMFDPTECILNVRDNQDMTMTLTLRMDTDNDLYLLLLQQDYLNVRPAAVSINYRIAPLFKIFWVDRAKDSEYGVWDDGVWAKEEEFMSYYRGEEYVVLSKNKR